jgi:hypothetical protein
MIGPFALIAFKSVTPILFILALGTQMPSEKWQQEAIFQSYIRPWRHLSKTVASSSIKQRREAEVNHQALSTSLKEVGSTECCSLLGACREANRRKITSATLEPAGNLFLLRIAEIFPDKQVVKSTITLYPDLVVKEGRSGDSPSDQWNLTSMVADTMLMVQPDGTFELSMAVSNRNGCTFQGVLEYQGNARELLFDGSGPCQEMRREDRVARQRPPSTEERRALLRRNMARARCIEANEYHRLEVRLAEKTSGGWRRYGNINIPWSRWTEVAIDKRLNGYFLDPEDGRLIASWGGSAVMRRQLGQPTLHKLPPRWVSISCETATYSVNSSPPAMQQLYAFMYSQSLSGDLLFEDVHKELNWIQRLIRRAPLVDSLKWTEWKVPEKGSDWERVLIDMCSNIPT